MTTATLERETTIVPDRLYETSNNNEDSAHIVMVPPGEKDETPQAYVMRARVEGFPITALCGFTWIPYRSAAGLPTCEGCLEVYHRPGDNRDDRNELPDE